MPGLFDKMKSGITEKAMEASIRSKEAIEAQQVKSKMGDLENQKRKTFLELGEAVHLMILNSSLDEAALTAQSAAITALDAQVKEKERELEPIHKAADQQVAELKSADAGRGAGAAAGGAFCP